MKGKGKKSGRSRPWDVGLGSASELPPDLSKLSRREVIAHYHTIQKQLALVDRSPQFPNEASREARRNVLRAQLALIGIDKYQNASREGEACSGGFDSSLWVLSELQTRARELCAKDSALSVLDVGAIAHRFPEHLDIACADERGSQTRRIALNVTSIDLNPEDSEAGRRVIKADFFDFASTRFDEKAERHDVLCLSLCINFEGCANRRGLMMYLAARLLRIGGLLFTVLPRACVSNSRYLDGDRFSRLQSAVGLDAVSTKYSSKLFQSISRKTTEIDKINPSEWAGLSRREQLRGGGQKNNFAIHLNHSTLLEYANARKKALSDSGLRHFDKKGFANLRIPVPPAAPIGKSHRTSNQRRKARRKAMRKQKGLSDSHGEERG